MKEKVWNEPKTVVTLHRQSDKTSSERQQKRELKNKHFNINNLN